MPLDPKRLRKWFAGVAILVIAVSLGFYLYARLRTWHAVERTPQKFGVNVRQSTQGFTLSKSEGGRTIFTVHASNAVQYKEGGKAELHNVSILVYGNRSDRFDQIYGDNFEYDANSGNIAAQGDVGIDLEGNAQGPARPDQTPPIELKNPVHLKTSGLIFNQKTGAAATREKIEFRIPQATGSAVGASYDSKTNTLTLDSQVRLETLQGATILAQHGVVTQNPRRALLENARVERASSEIQANHVTLHLRDDNTVSRAVADGDVRARTRGLNPARVEATHAELVLGLKDAIQSGLLSGGVKFEQGGPSPLHGTAGEAKLEFGGGNLLAKVHAFDGVQLLQSQRATSTQAAQSVQLDSESLDLFLIRGRPEHGLTGGRARITIHPQSPTAQQGDTVVTAGRFQMMFGDDSRLRSMHGEPDARIVASAPGQPDKVSLSQSLDVAFSPAGEISSLVQRGDVRYSDSQRTATASQARYTPSDTNLVLTGSPRWSEGTAVTTAQVLRFNRRTGEGFGEGDVKTTYREPRPRTGGALLGASEPVHVTANSMSARQGTNVATYKGSARLWQRSNIVEAPVIEFDRVNRLLTAEGTRQPVSTAFVQNEAKGKAAPITVTSSHLTYSDPERRAVFQGSVLLKSEGGTVTADHADVLLQPRSQDTALKGNSDASQIERIVAQGHVVLQQPTRKAVGNKLVYTSSDEKYVLTGGRPSIFDAERGVTSGDSLTFYNRNDTVLVGSQNSHQTVTQTNTGK